MRFEEALKAMREGKYAICGDVIYKIEDNELLRKGKDSKNWCRGDCVFGVLSENWEVVEE